MRFELLVANQRDGLGPQVLNGALKLLNEVAIELAGNTRSWLTVRIQLSEIAPDKWTIVTSGTYSDNVFLTWW